MIYSEKQYKLLEQQLRQLKKENELKDKENKILKTQKRPIKIKQKIGKFRSETGAELYAEICSCINTYKKQNYSPFNMLLKGFNGNLQVI